MKRKKYCCNPKYRGKQQTSPAKRSIGANLFILYLPQKSVRMSHPFPPREDPAV